MDLVLGGFYGTARTSGKDALYIISVEDVQEIAKRTIGRELTSDELYRVKKGIEWVTVVKTAIRDAVE